MNSLVSPFKIFDSDLNYVKIGSNEELGNELRAYLADSANHHLWKLSTHRQTTTHALRFTESIHLRFLKDLPTGVSTIESNQWMEIGEKPVSNEDIFKKAISWFEKILLNTGADQVEFGRIFISKLSANSVIDLHVDSGKYFSYYDRFHFTITAAEENIFVIRNDECILENDSLFWVNNHVPHWLENRSSEDRINFIIDARLS
jgi:Aspartyl/Asparaginyl beta-hydroxylase